jgi:hypothetical protein
MRVPQVLTSGLEVRGRFFAAFRLNIVADLLAFVKALKARALAGRWTLPLDWDRLEKLLNMTASQHDTKVLTAI